MLSPMPDSFCTDCGAPLVGNKKFCAACGTKAPEEMAPSPITPTAIPMPVEPPVVRVQDQRTPHRAESPGSPADTPASGPAPQLSSTPQNVAMSREEEAEQRRRRIAEVERQRQADAEEKRFLRVGGIVVGLIIAALLIYQGTRPSGDPLNGVEPCEVQNNCDDPTLP